VAGSIAKWCSAGAGLTNGPSSPRWRWGKAFAAPFALLLGPFVIILAVGAVYGRVGDHRIVHVVLDGVAAAVVGLSFATGINAIARGTPEATSVAIAALTVLCVGGFGWPMLPVMLGLAPVSIGLALLGARRR
jgi:chromate transporter